MTLTILKSTIEKFRRLSLDLCLPYFFFLGWGYRVVGGRSQRRLATDGIRLDPPAQGAFLHCQVTASPLPRSPLRKEVAGV